MTQPINDMSVHVTRKDGLTFHLRGGTTPEGVLAALAVPGERLKESKKSLTRRVGDWVIKESLPQSGIGPLKHTFRRSRYRQAWVAANFLANRGVLAPEPIALVERTFLGVILKNIFICEYLDGFVNVEEFVKHLISANTTPIPQSSKSPTPSYFQRVLQDFFAGLAAAVNRLTDTGAYHTDLSGKNIFTRFGKTFCFIDLDAVVVGKRYTDDLRMKNHVQLYDSFCDFVGDDFLVPFISSILPNGHHVRDWFPNVREAQRARRARYNANKEDKG